MKSNFQPSFKSMSTQMINSAISAFKLLVAIICCASVGYAQDGTSHEIGLKQVGAYAIGDIETINMSNGNLTLNLRLASLPPGRGNVSAGVMLNYNSKYFAVYRQLYDYITPAGNTTTYTTERLTQRFGLSGGWKYNIKYLLNVERKEDTYPAGAAPACPNPEAPYDTKVKILFPDGSEHVFRPLGFYEYYLRSDGFFNVDPAGSCRSCQGNALIFTPCAPGNRLVYYSIDGSYIRLEVGLSQSGNTLAWTMYFPDGTRVMNREIVDGVMIDQRIYDRNGNYIEFQDITHNGHPATRIADQLNRAVIIEYDAASHQDYIYHSGHGGATLTTIVKWKQNYVHKLYNPSVDGIEIPQLGLIDYTASQYVVDQILLPAQTGGLRYTFGYNGSDTDPSSNYTHGWGELNSAILPTGAQATYHYIRDGQNSIFTQDVMQNAIAQKDLSYQAKHDGISSAITNTWTYSFSAFGNFASVTGPDGSVNAEWFYKGNQFSWPPPNPDSWDNNLSIKSEGPEKKVERIWQPNTPPGISSPSGPVVMINPYLKTEFTSVKNTSGNYTKTSIKDYKIDKNGNIITIAEYDWVNYGDVPRDANGMPTGIPGTAQVKRVTVNEYFNPTPDSSDSSTSDPDIYHLSTSPNYRQALKSREVRAGFDASSVLSRGEYFYDDPTRTANLTEQRSWDSTKGAISYPLQLSNSISVAQQYDTYGNRTLTTDANGVQTQFIYDPINGHSNLYVTQTKAAVGTAVQRWTTQAYDFHTGQVTQSTDMDNNVTTRTTYDVFGRPILVEEADGIAGVEKHTATEYSDTERRVIVRSDLNTISDGKLITVRHYDQLGRTCLTRRLESGNPIEATDETKGVKIQARYFAGDSNNSYELVSAPYRAATSGAASGEPGMAWKRTKLDRGGRVIEVETFVGATPPAPWGSNSISSGKFTTEYEAEFTTVTDQAGKKRRSRVDGMGRLVRVDEPDAVGNLGSVTAPIQPTNYTYNALDNLVQISQTGIPNGGSTPVTQTRTFTFSSLGRLISANNPESGLISHEYDANGNLKKKTDARNVFINYTYDELNRNRTVDYSNTAVNPDITRVYDNPAAEAYGKGKFWKDYAGGDDNNGPNVEHKEVDSYDALGRPLSVRRKFKYNGVWSAPFTTSQIYDLAGDVKTKSYPSGRGVTYTYDVSGDLTGFTGNIGDGVSRTYSTGIQYNPQGQLIREQFGTSTPLYHRRHYNSRGQLFDVRLGTDSSAINDGPNPAQWTGASWNRGALRMFFSSNLIEYGWPAVAPQANNGNLHRQDHFVPTALDGGGNVTGWVMSADYYCYDSLNRVAQTAEETYTGVGGYTPNVFNQQFSYDRFGNRLVSSATGTGAPNPGYKINGANNRLIAPTDADGSQALDKMQYDLSGNLIKDTHTQTGTAGNRDYDAENRMVTAVGANGLANSYTYDADGHRTRRTINNGGEVWWQVFGISGELVAEYQLISGTPTLKKEYGYRNGQLMVIAETTGTCQWLVTDALGTPRMIADKTGSLGGMKRRDYLPFGEEILAGVGHRQAANGYSLSQSQQPRQQFTGKERDPETWLDYFEARYYGSVYGRFTSPDEFTGGPDELYDFADVASNNPTFYADLIDPQSLNKYQYCYNDPLATIDPDGHKGFKERLRDAVAAVADYGNGIVKGVVNSASYGTLNETHGPKPSDSLINRIGQGVGSLGTMVVGGGFVGGGVKISATGVGAIVGVPAAAYGSTLVIGGGVNLGKVINTPIQNTGNSQQSGGSEKPPFGHRGTQTTSTTVWKAKGSKERIDVENPNPGKRPGQIHYQDKNNKKYLYNPERNEFTGASDTMNKQLLSRPEIQKAIQKARKLLGEE